MHEVLVNCLFKLAQEKCFLHDVGQVFSLFWFHKLETKGKMWYAAKFDGAQRGKAHFREEKKLIFTYYLPFMAAADSAAGYF